MVKVGNFIDRKTMKSMVDQVRPMIEQTYEMLELTEEEMKDWYLNDQNKELNFQTWETDLEKEITCPRCGRTYKLKEAKVCRGSYKNETAHFCKYYPECKGSGFDLYLHLFDDDPEPNK